MVSAAVTAGRTEAAAWAADPATTRRGGSSTCGFTVANDMLRSSSLTKNSRASIAIAATTTFRAHSYAELPNRATLPSLSPSLDPWLQRLYRYNINTHFVEWTTNVHS